MIREPESQNQAPEEGRKPHQFTLEQWRTMVEKGVFQKNERLEFVEGRIIVMSPVNRPHSSCVKRLNQLSALALGETAIISVQDPLLIGQDEFYPDVVLLKPRADFYNDKDPTPEDAFLVIEVADSTLKTDQEFKGAKYAAGGVGEYWVVDLNHERVWVYRNPKDGAYTQTQALERGSSLSVQALPQIQLHVEDVLGKKQ